MKRLFIAIKIQPDKGFLDQFFQLRIHLEHERIKWVEDHNIHVTLKFLGDTESKKIPLVESSIQEVVAGHSPFTVKLYKLGLFGSRYDPRVIWIGIEPYDYLVKLMKDIHAALEPIGYERDRQNIVPHLTLGRIKEVRDKKLFQLIIEKFRNTSSSGMIVRDCLLYESILKREGPVYMVQNAFPFGSLDKTLPAVPKSGKGS